jgi:uncharacterized protein (UPF0548 family)
LTDVTEFDMVENCVGQETFTIEVKELTERSQQLLHILSFSKAAFGFSKYA